jgi:hypothetical protein
MAVRYFLPSAVAVSCPTCLLPLFVRPSVHQRQKRLGERERESLMDMGRHWHLYIPNSTCTTTSTTNYNYSPFCWLGFVRFFLHPVGCWVTLISFNARRHHQFKYAQRSRRRRRGSFGWCMCPAVIASVVRSMALLFVRIFFFFFFLCSFKQEKKYLLFFSSLFFLPLIFGFPCCVRPCWPHHQTIRRVWKLSSTDLQINTQQPLLALWWFFVVVVCLVPKVPQGWNTKCDAYLFSLYCKSIGFFFFFLSLVFTFPIFSYHFDDMSKTNSGQPPPHSARVCCIKWRCLSLISFPRTHKTRS